MSIYTVTIHHYVTFRYKHNIVHLTVLLWFSLCSRRNREIETNNKNARQISEKIVNKTKQFIDYLYTSREIIFLLWGNAV